MADTGRVFNSAVRNFICDHAEKKLEANPTFIKVFGKNFARKSLNTNIAIAYTNEPKGISTYAGYYSSSDHSITIVSTNNSNNLLTPEEILSDPSIEETCIHEAIHALLERSKAECNKYHISSGTGLLEVKYDKHNQISEIGRGLNEGFTEWMCEQLGYETQAYPELTDFVRLVSTFIGTEKTMELGKGGIFQRFPGILDMNIQSVVTLLGISDDLYFQRDQIQKLSGMMSAIKLFNQDGRSEDSINKAKYDAYLPDIERFRNTPDYTLYINNNQLEDNEDSLVKFIDSIIENRKESATVDVVRFDSMILDKYFEKDMHRILNGQPMSKEDFEKCVRIMGLLNIADVDIPENMRNQKPPYSALEFAEKFEKAREKHMDSLDIAAGEQYKSGEFKALEYLSYLDKVYSGSPSSYYIKEKHLGNFVSQIAPEAFRSDIIDILHSLDNSKSDTKENREALKKLTQTTIFRLKSKDSDKSVESSVIFSEDNFYSKYFSKSNTINKNSGDKVDLNFTLTQDEDYDNIMEQFDTLREDIFKKTPDAKIHIASREIIVKNGDNYDFYTIDAGQIVPMEIEDSFDFNCELGEKIKDEPQTSMVPQKTSRLSNMFNTIRGKLLGIFKNKNSRESDFGNTDQPSTAPAPKDVQIEDHMSQYVQSTITGKYDPTLDTKEHNDEKGIEEER